MPLTETGKLIVGVECYLVNGEKILMFQRSQTSKRYPGLWVGPGGVVDHNEDMVTTAIREVFEETGIRITKGQVKLKVIAIQQMQDRNETIIIPIFLVKLKTHKKCNGCSEGSSKWLTRKELKKLEGILPLSKFYHDHVLNDKPGILFTNVLWDGFNVVKIFGKQVIKS